MAQTSYALSSARPGQPGLPVDGFAPQYIISRNVGGGVAQVTTIQVTGVVNSVAHSVDITYNNNTVRVSFTADGSATANEVAAGLEAAFDAEPELCGLFVASVSTDTITLTGRVPGASWTSAVADNLTATIDDSATAAASATAIPFGRGVVQRASYPNQCLLPSTANDTLQVWHATPTQSNDATYTLTLTYNLHDGLGTRVLSRSYLADGSASVQEIVEALQGAMDAALPANSIAITEDNTKVIFTSEVPNLSFTVTGTATSGVTAWTISNATALVPLRFLGVSLQSHSLEQSSTGTVSYQGGDPVSIMNQGCVWVELDASITPSVGDPVWCRCSASGTEVLGAFRDAQDAADCIPIPGAAWVDDSAYTVGGVRIAKLRILSAAL